jgi:tRNA-dihydrouridine synthase B
VYEGAVSYWHTQVRIGDRSFGRFIGGPLDGLTDAPFRQLVRSISPDALLYTEIRHVMCVSHDKGGAKALAFDQKERPLNFQITANSLDGIDQAIEKIVARGVDCVDLNIGCPANNIVGSGSGSALMADVPLLEKIVRRIRSQLAIPFTVKMRAGFKEANALEVASLLQDCGVDAIALHPRLRTQRFSGEPDYDLVTDVKKRVTIPVLVSGGITSWDIANKVYEQTGADGFLIGRGMIGRPWVLAQFQAQSQGISYPDPSVQDILAIALRHFDAMFAVYGPPALYMFRKHAACYLDQCEGMKAVRAALMEEESIENVRNVLIGLRERR